MSNITGYNYNNVKIKYNSNSIYASGAKELNSASNSSYSSGVGASSNAGVYYASNSNEAYLKELKALLNSFDTSKTFSSKNYDDLMKLLKNLGIKPQITESNNVKKIVFTYKDEANNLEVKVTINASISAATDPNNVENASDSNPNQNDVNNGSEWNPSGVQNGSESNPDQNDVNNGSEWNPSGVQNGSESNPDQNDVNNGSEWNPSGVENSDDSYVDPNNVGNGSDLYTDDTNVENDVDKTDNLFVMAQARVQVNEYLEEDTSEEFQKIKELINDFVAGKLTSSDVIEYMDNVLGISFNDYNFSYDNKDTKKNYILEFSYNNKSYHLTCSVELAENEKEQVVFTNSDFAGTSLLLLKNYFDVVAWTGDDKSEGAIAYVLKSDVKLPNSVPRNIKSEVIAYIKKQENPTIIQYCIDQFLTGQASYEKVREVLTDFGCTIEEELQDANGKNDEPGYKYFEFKDPNGNSYCFVCKEENIGSNKSEDLYEPEYLQSIFTPEEISEYFYGVSWTLDSNGNGATFENGNSIANKYVKRTSVEWPGFGSIIELDEKLHPDKLNKNLESLIKDFASGNLTSSDVINYMDNVLGISFNDYKFSYDNKNTKKNYILEFSYNNKLYHIECPVFASDETNGRNDITLEIITADQYNNLNTSIKSYLQAVVTENNKPKYYTINQTKAPGCYTIEDLKNKIANGPGNGDNNGKINLEDFLKKFAGGMLTSSDVIDYMDNTLGISFNDYKFSYDNKNTKKNYILEFSYNNKLYHIECPVFASDETNGRNDITLQIITADEYKTLDNDVKSYLKAVVKENNNALYYAIDQDKVLKDFKKNITDINSLKKEIDAVAAEAAKKLQNAKNTALSTIKAYYDKGSFYKEAVIATLGNDYKTTINNCKTIDEVQNYLNSLDAKIEELKLNNEINDITKTISSYEKNSDLKGLITYLKNKGTNVSVTFANDKYTVSFDLKVAGAPTSATINNNRNNSFYYLMNYDTERPLAKFLKTYNSDEDKQKAIYNAVADFNNTKGAKDIEALVSSLKDKGVNVKLADNGDGTYQVILIDAKDNKNTYTIGDKQTISQSVQDIIDNKNIDCTFKDASIQLLKNNNNKDLDKLPNNLNNCQISDKTIDGDKIKVTLTYTKDNKTYTAKLTIKNTLENKKAVGINIELIDFYNYKSIKGYASNMLVTGKVSTSNSAQIEYAENQAAIADFKQKLTDEGLKFEDLKAYAESVLDRQLDSEEFNVMINSILSKMTFKGGTLYNNKADGSWSYKIQDAVNEFVSIFEQRVNSNTLETAVITERKEDNLAVFIPLILNSAGKYAPFLKSITDKGIKSDDYNYISLGYVEKDGRKEFYDERGEFLYQQINDVVKKRIQEDYRVTINNIDELFQKAWNYCFNEEEKKHPNLNAILKAVIGKLFEYFEAGEANKATGSVSDNGTRTGGSGNALSYDDVIENMQADLQKIALYKENNPISANTTAPITYLKQGLGSNKENLYTQLYNYLKTVWNGSEDEYNTIFNQVFETVYKDTNIYCSGNCTNFYYPQALINAIIKGVIEEINKSIVADTSIAESDGNTKGDEETTGGSTPPVADNTLSIDETEDSITDDSQETVVLSRISYFIQNDTILKQKMKDLYDESKVTADFTTTYNQTIGDVYKQIQSDGKTSATKGEIRALFEQYFTEKLNKLTPGTPTNDVPGLVNDRPLIPEDVLKISEISGISQDELLNLFFDIKDGEYVLKSGLTYVSNNGRTSASQNKQPITTISGLKLAIQGNCTIYLNNTIITYRQQENGRRA